MFVEALDMSLKTHISCLSLEPGAFNKIQIKMTINLLTITNNIIL